MQVVAGSNFTGKISIRVTFKYWHDNLDKKRQQSKLNTKLKENLLNCQEEHTIFSHTMDSNDSDHLILFYTFSFFSSILLSVGLLKDY